MLILKQFGNPWGRGDLSPFCSKVETYLRMAGLEYRTEVGDVRKAPRGKLPVVTDGDLVVCDSRRIVEHFESRADTPLDADLSATQRALSVALRGLVEEELYFYVLYLRWQEDDGWAVYVSVIRDYAKSMGVPGFMASLVAGRVRKQVITSLHGQGTGRHSRQEVEERACEIIDALSVHLGTQSYFLGERPHTLDATLFAWLDSILEGPFPGKLKDHTAAQPNLVAYCARMRERYFADAAVAAARAQDEHRAHA